ncbi:methylthioribose kinase MtnK [Gottschalkia purinilytica]|uniref:S-methyl-5-thioribose kinase n=2 Tax=Gottschalkia purinilytica TaxID=1503 RepID=A0A0L0W851_GOTPU|nr:methylthioribose kinase MtnK [Gottschalkia purinilytica]
MLKLLYRGEAIMYKTLSLKDVCDYVKSNTDIFNGDDTLEAIEVSDGNVNLVFRVMNIKDKCSVIVKQALPYLKIAGEDWKLTLERNKLESESMKFQQNHCEEFVPKVYYQDDKYATFIMEDCSDMKILRTAMMDLEEYPNFPSQIGTYLARNLFFTSDFGLDAKSKKKMISKFVNPDLCDITERLVFTEPYYNCDSNDINPYIMDNVKRIWEDESLKSEIDILRHIFMNKSEALIHGDLHTGSIFISHEKCKVFDSEFTFYGPISYDIGLLYANIIINYFYWEKSQKHNDKIEDYKKHLLSNIKEIWSNFTREFIKLYKNNLKIKVLSKERFLESYLKNVLSETIGFCSCEIMRRVIGLAHTQELDVITDKIKKAKFEKCLLDVAEKLLINRNSIDINEFLEIIYTGELELSESII